MASATQVLPTVCFLFCGLTVYLSTVSATRQRQAGTSITTRTPTTTQDSLVDFEEYIPTTPSPDNVNCYIEVPTLQTVGGRCVRFGQSRMWSCQSGIHIQISNDCERLSRRSDQGRRRPRQPRP